MTAFSVILPVLFVMGLGYWAGRSKQFDQDQVKGLNALVLQFALPALLFVGVVSASRSALLAAVPFALAILVATGGLFLLATLFCVFVLRRKLGPTAIQAGCVSNANVAFAGVPILTSLFGASSTFSVAASALILNVTIVPAMVTMLEYDRQRSAGAKSLTVAGLIRQSLFTSFKQPYVWGPLLAAVLVLLDLRPPSVFENMLDLIGSTTSGVALFLAGLILAAYRIAVSAETLGNTAVKTIAQPVLMAFLVAAFGVAKPLGIEGIVICTLPTAVICPMLALRYNVYEAESATTMLLTTIAIVVAIPAAIAFLH
jgi:malonate transporter and related proteins